MFVPNAILKNLYTNGSLTNTEDGFQFELKNRLIPAKLLGVRRVAVDGREVSLDGSIIQADDGRVLTPNDVSADTPADFDLGDRFEVRLRGAPLTPGTHALEIEFEAQPVGRLTLSVDDTIAA